MHASASSGSGAADFAPAAAPAAAAAPPDATTPGGSGVPGPLAADDGGGGGAPVGAAAEAGDTWRGAMSELNGGSGPAGAGAGDIIGVPTGPAGAADPIAAAGGALCATGPPPAGTDGAPPALGDPYAPAVELAGCAGGGVTGGGNTEPPPARPALNPREKSEGGGVPAPAADGRPAPAAVDDNPAAGLSPPEPTAPAPLAGVTDPAPDKPPEPGIFSPPPTPLPIDDTPPPPAGVVIGAIGIGVPAKVPSSESAVGGSGFGVVPSVVAGVAGFAPLWPCSPGLPPSDAESPPTSGGLPSTPGSNSAARGG